MIVRASAVAAVIGLVAPAACFVAPAVVGRGSFSSLAAAALKPAISTAPALRMTATVPAASVISAADQAIKNAGVANVLSEALPYIMEHAGETIVIKYGGHAMENPEASLNFARDVVLLKQCGVNPVVVHGGGPQIAAMLKRLNITTSFVEGLRVTDSETVEVAEMVLCGNINKGIAGNIKQAGGRAVGLSGKDDRLILAEKYQKIITDPATGQSKMLDIGFVGEIKKVNTQVIVDLVNAGIVPVIAPIGVDERGQTYNCNADTAAGAIAGALKANRLLLLTDVKGVLDKEGKLMQELTLDDVNRLMSDGTIYGGMIPKLDTAIRAVKAGVGASIVLDGRVKHALLLELFTSGGAGTLIKMGDEA